MSRFVDTPQALIFVDDQHGGADPSGHGVEKVTTLQPRATTGRFSRDPGETFMSGTIVTGIPGVKAKSVHEITELKDDEEIDEEVEGDKAS